MNEPPYEPKTGSRRLIWMVLIICLLIAALVTAWYYTASKMDQQLTKLVQDQSEKGRELNCNDRQTTGFPFRIGFTCEQFSFRDDQTGQQVESGAVRTAAQLYNPGQIVLELESPLNLSAPKLGKGTIKWKSGRASTKIGFDGPNRISLALTDANAELNLKSLGSPNSLGSMLLFADNAQLHMRKTDKPGAVDIAFSFNQALAKGRQIPAVEPVNLSGDFEVLDFEKAVRSRKNMTQYLRQNGLSGDARNLTVFPVSGGRITISGPFSVSKSGLLSGKFNLSVTEAGKLVGWLSNVFPNAASDIRQASQIINALPAGLGNTRSIPLVIKQGKVYAGIIPLGEIPPLY